MNRSTIALVIGLLASAAGHAATIHVSTCGSDTNTGQTSTCGGANGPKATLAAAIAASANGDEILVHPGVYAGVILMPNRRLTLRAPGGPSVTRIVGGTSGSPTFVFQQTASADSVIDGFTMSGAVANTSGAAIRTMVSLSVRNCRFEGNTTTGNGAAIAQYDGVLTLTDCVFDDNTANSGGMVSCLGGSMTATRCDFRNAPGGPGAGAISGVDLNLTLTDCVFVQNAASAGSAISGSRGVLTIERCWFGGNFSTGSGGAVAVASYETPMQVSIRNSVFSRNHSQTFGGAVTVSGNPLVTIDHCTFNENTTGNENFPNALSFSGGSILTLTNSIVRGQGWNISAPNASSTVSNCVLTSGWSGAGAGNTLGDPLFVNAFLNDYRLLPASPAIDAASTTAPATMDYLRLPRTVDVSCVGSGADIGAYEVQAHNFNGDGAVDVCQILEHPWMDCSNNGVLDEAESRFPLTAQHDTTGQPQRVVGAPDDIYIGLGANQVTLDFGDRPLVNGAGPDLNVYEVDFGVLEFGLIDVLVSADGVTFFSVKSSEGAAVDIDGDEAHNNPSYARSYDLGPSGLAEARFVRVRALSPGNAGNGDGFDLDAVGGVNIRDLPPCPSFCPADVNGDGTVDFADLNIVLSEYNTSAPGSPADVDQDGDVDFADLNLVLSAYNAPCN